ncbi:MAG: HD domain-containing protein [Actinomycetota bacterium]
MTTVAEVCDLCARRGGERYDEDVTQTDHAIQCAALARADGADDALVVAALLHDVGHLLDLDRGGAYVPGVDRRHEVVGVEYLAAVFPAEVADPVLLHVEAKRYLCATEHAYAAGLSAGSQRSLAVQGGPMTAAEATAFLARPGAEAAIRLRRWDDAGKVVGLHRPAFASYRPLLDALAGSGQRI